MASLLLVGAVASAVFGQTVADRSAGGRSPAPVDTPTVASRPRHYLIHLIDGGDPIVVKHYVEEGDEIRFEKFGGWVGIPKYEVLRIVPDIPGAEVAANLPPPPPILEAPPRAVGGGSELGDPQGDVPTPTGVAIVPGVPTVSVHASAAGETLYVTMRGRAEMRATAVAPEGDRVRVTVPEGSFTIQRTDLIGVVRVTPGADVAEAWLTLWAAESAIRSAQPDPTDDGPVSGPPTTPASVPPAGGGSAVPAGASSDRAHLVRLANGQVLRVEGFWVEGGELKFRRLGGLVGIALSEIARLLPEESPPPGGRTAVRYARQLGPDLLEVQVRSGGQPVRLIGVDPVAAPGRPLEAAASPDNPWEGIERGVVIHLEFDRQRYDPAGHWLAYVFLPSGRMLNAELIRLGLARPRSDGRNLRYLDLFQEVAALAASPVLTPR